MTTTVRPITLDTHCPAWCTKHISVAMDDQDPVKVRHEAPTTLDFVSDDTTPRVLRRVTVTPELYVRDNGTTEPVVYFHDEVDGVLNSAAEVERVIAALREAATLAFGSEPAGVTR